MCTRPYAGITTRALGQRMKLQTESSRFAFYANVRRTPLIERITSVENPIFPTNTKKLRLPPFSFLRSPKHNSRLLPQSPPSLPTVRTNEILLVFSASRRRTSRQNASNLMANFPLSPIH